MIFLLSPFVMCLIESSSDKMRKWVVSRARLEISQANDFVVVF